MKYFQLTGAFWLITAFVINVLFFIFNIEFYISIKIDPKGKYQLKMLIIFNLLTSFIF